MRTIARKCGIELLPRDHSPGTQPAPNSSGPSWSLSMPGKLTHGSLSPSVLSPYYSQALGQKVEWQASVLEDFSLWSPQIITTQSDRCCNVYWLWGPEVGGICPVWQSQEDQKRWTVSQALKMSSAQPAFMKHHLGTSQNAKTGQGEWAVVGVFQQSSILILFTSPLLPCFQMPAQKSISSTRVIFWFQPTPKSTSLLNPWPWSLFLNQPKYHPFAEAQRVA